MICEKCGKSFKSNRGYTGHIENNICEKYDKINKLKCQKCHNIFSSITNLQYHSNNVNCISIQKYIPSNSKIITLQQKIKIKIKLKIFETPKPTDIELKKQSILKDIELLLPYDNTIIDQVNQKFKLNSDTNNNCQTIIINNPNININFNIAPAFLEMETIENIKKYYPNAITEALNHLKSPDGLIKILSQTTCNPLHPIFNSVYMDKIDSRVVKVSNGKNYIESSFEEISKELIVRKMEIIKNEVPVNREDRELLKEICESYIFMFKFAPNYPDYDPDAVERLNKYKSIKPDVMESFSSMTKHIQQQEWKMKLDMEMKEFLLSTN